MVGALPQDHYQSAAKRNETDRQVPHLSDDFSAVRPRITHYQRGRVFKLFGHVGETHTAQK
jgi:hypothetical protein